MCPLGQEHAGAVFLIHRRHSSSAARNLDMATPALAQFLALNDQLVALVRAGVPMHLGLPSRTAGAVQACERIGAGVAHRLGEGATVAQALDDATIPGAYRCVVQLALSSGELAPALAGASRFAELQDDSLQAVRHALRYPLVICCLAYAGIVLFCLFLVPTLENMYQGMRIPVGSGLRAVTLLRQTLPYWVALPPIGLALFILIRRRSSWGTERGGTAHFAAWLPGMSKVARQQRLTRFAETLAGHLDAGVPLPEGLRMAAAAWENDPLEQAALAHAAALASGQTPSEHSPFAAALPPLLRWAVWHADEPIGKAWALRMAAGAYRESAQRRVGRVKILAPIVACLVIGGVVVLLYALALFVPVVQMLHGLAG